MYNSRALYPYIGSMIVVNFNEKTYIGALYDVNNSTILLKYAESCYRNDMRLYKYSKMDGNIIIDGNSIRSVYYYNNITRHQII